MHEVVVMGSREGCLKGEAKRGTEGARESESRSKGGYLNGIGVLAFRDRDKSRFS